MDHTHTAWVEVDLEAVRHNCREVKRFAGGDIAVMAVLKTNAYGHGLELVARALEGEAGWFGVSTVEEGLRVRQAGLRTPTLVFHPCSPWNASLLVGNDLTASVGSASDADALAAAGPAAGKAPAAHLKIDTGMARFGVPARDAETIAALLNRSDIRWDGVYTHLATALERDTGAAQAQLEAFQNALKVLPETGQPPRWVHALNSAGLLRFPLPPCNMVRAGTLLFGQYPTPHGPRPLDLRPTWRFRTRIVALRQVAAGASVGYASEWRASRPSVIATIPVGYADGFTVEPRSVWQRSGGWRGLARRITRKDVVTVQTPRGSAPVVGRVAAQSAMLDVTELPGISVGDVVEVRARRVLVGEHIPRLPVNGFSGAGGF
jgi:alanine racemase